MEALRVAFGLGANLGDPLGQVHRAASELARNLDDARVASPYRSASLLQTGPPQEDYINTVVLGRSRRSAREWLAWAKALELRSGRLPTYAWGPRHLDIDLLFVGETVRRDRDLVLPHPHWSSRIFVVAPLAELEPDWVPPGETRSITSVLESLSEASQSLRRLQWPRPVQAAPTTFSGSFSA